MMGGCQEVDENGDVIDCMHIENYSSSWLGIENRQEDDIGFVYMIKHGQSGKYYIGKKGFYRAVRRKPLKGQKRIRKDKVESDWESYWGSSKKFLEYAEQEGKDKFDRIIMRFCKTKSELSYEELKAQIKHDVLNDPLSFNGIINVRLNRTK